MEKQRSDLKILFRDGARPTGKDFEDFLDSFAHISDGVQVTNFTLGSFTLTPVAGSMRFTAAGDVQFFNGTVWKNVSSNDTGFSPLGAQPPAPLPDAAYFGKIGINQGSTPPALTEDFEVGLVVPATALVNKVRVGEAIIGGDTNGEAVFLHRSLKLATAVNAGNVSLNYAVAQTKQGSVVVNAPQNQNIKFSINDVPQMQLQADAFVVGAIAPLTPTPYNPPPLPGDKVWLHVDGHAVKSKGGNTWLTTSDVRTKKDISDFKDGLEKLKKIRAVNFRYNGKGGTSDGHEQVGLIGQEVEEVFPYMVKRMGNKTSENGETDFPEDMILLDSSPLVYILINAVREMDEKIEQLKNNQHANS